jgi:replicative DNA helicase
MSDPFELLSEEPPAKAPDPSLPPHSIESEKGVLGCILLSNEAFDEIIEYGVTTQWFYDLKHRDLFVVMLSMHAEREAIDMVTLSNALAKSGKMDAVGGLVYVSNLQDSVPSASHLAYYLEILKEKSVARMSIAACKELHDSIMAGKNPFECIAKLERTIIDIGSNAITRSLLDMKGIAKEVATRMDLRFQGRRVGIKTGFHDIDKATDGLDGQQLWIIAGRPSCGKTALSVNIGENIARSWIEQKVDKAVVIFSLEMSEIAIGERMVSGASEVNLRTIGPGMAEGDMKKLFKAVTGLASLNKHMIIDPTSSMSMASMMAKARHYYRRNNAGLFIVDYLQLIQGDNRGQRREEVDGISRDLKRLAKELNVPVIALSQLNREVDKETKRKPRMSDLRESGQIEQDADFIGILYNPNQNQDEIRPSDNRQINLRVCKQRGGGKEMDIPLMFMPVYTKFANLSREVDE